MKRSALLLLFLPLFALSPVRAAWIPGENLLTPVPPSKDWEVSEKKEGDFRSRLWQKKGEGIKDSYIVSIISGFNKKLPEFRDEQDNPGKKNCETFDSEVLDDSETNGYSRLMWRTRCGGKSGFTASILQVAIQGHDSFYHVQKIWRGEVPEKEMAFWREQLSSTSVCDTRGPKNPCPEGFHQVQ
jgi:hypothetical protein